MNRFKSEIFLLLLLLISVFVYHSWFSWNIFTSGDWGFGHAESLKEYLNLHIWFSWSSFGSVDYLLWRTPITYLTGIVGSLGYNSNVSDKVLVFIPSIFIANVSIYYLIKKITNSNLSSLIGSIVFNYNTYWFVASNAYLLYAGAAWSVLTLLIFIYALEKRKIYLFILSSLTLFITGAYDFRVAYISVFLLIFYFLFFNFFIQKFQRKLFINNLLSFLIVGVIFGLLNVYWLLPILNSHTLTSNIILDRGLFGNEFLNILYSISFFHPFWTGQAIALFNPQTVFFYFWLIPIFAFLGLLLNKNNKLFLFFGALSIGGIFLTKQVGHPFINVYPFLFEHFPGFSAFREASKFYFIIALSYSVMIAGFVRALIKSRPKRKIEQLGKIILVLLIPTIFLLNTIPIINGDFLGIFVPHKINSDYLALKERLIQDKDYSRVLWVPAFSRWGFVNNNHPQLGAIDEIDNSWNYLIKDRQNPNIMFQAELVKLLFEKEGLNNLLNSESVKYVVIPRRDKNNEDDIFIFYGKDRNYYISLLDKLPYLKKIKMSKDGIIIYENLNYKPHIYETKEKEIISKDIPFEKIKSSFISSSEYNIQLKNIKEPIYLNFSENYHSQWNLRAGQFNWYSVFFDRNYFIDESYHFKNGINLNSFYLDPNKICFKFKCIQNADKSYNINLTLYFKPQSYLYLGLIISSLTFIFVITYLFFVLIKNLYERKN